MTHHGQHHIHWVPIVLALVLALLTWWLNDLARLPRYDDNRGFTHEPDAIVDQFRVLSFDRQGQPSSQLIAQHMRHFMDDDTTELIEPRLDFYDALRPARMEAHRGVIGSSGDNVYFLNQVHVQQAAVAPNPAFTLDTEFLHVIPEARVMRTDRAVILRQGRSVVLAGGLYMDDNQHLLLLSGGVKGTYERPK